MLEKLAKQSAIYGISTILGRLLSYLLTPYYTRLFSTEEYGIITDLYALIPFALVLLTMGMESSYFRFSAKAESATEKGKLFATTWGTTIIASALFCLAVYLFQGDITAAMGAAYVAQPILVSLVAAIIFFDVVACVPFAKLREEGAANKYVVLKLINIILQVGLAVGFGAAGLYSSTALGVGWVLVVNLTASVATLALILVAAKATLPKIDGKLLWAVLLYSLPLLLSGIAGTATEFIDRQMIKYIAPIGAMAQLGIYGAVTKIAVVMTLFTQMYRLAAEPFFLSSFKQDEFLESNAAAMKFYLIATIAILLGITLFADIFAFIVGRDFREGINILPVILLSNLLMGVWLNLSFWYKREEKTRFALYVTLIGLAATVVTNMALIPTYGYSGAAWARLCSEAIMVVSSYAIMRCYYPIPYDLRGITEYILVGAAIFGANYWLTNNISGVALWATKLALIFSYATFAVWREKIDLRGLLNSILRRRKERG